MLWRRLGRAGAVGSMRAPTWHFEAAWEGERGGSGGEWRAAERGTRVRDWGGGGGAGGLGEVDGGALEGGVWHHVGVVETDHLGVVGWSLWFDAPALLRRHIHILARIRPPAPPQPQRLAACGPGAGLRVRAGHAHRGSVVCRAGPHWAGRHFRALRSDGRSGLCYGGS